MGLILNIETSGKNCSVAIADNGKVLALKEVLSEQFVHAEQLHRLIQDLFSELSLKPAALNCVAISEGPGSYTGLRIGLAAAKGLCYSLGIPLIGVPTLKILANAAKKVDSSKLLVPMMDAKRMEVYTAVYEQNLNMLSPAAPVIVDSLFLEEYDDTLVAVFGDGAEKSLDFVKSAKFLPGIIAGAEFMLELSAKQYTNKEFVDLAYFEPNYLKEFQAGKPKNMFVK
jgi:tRNA threonylcarbamoyladenosine biosynthesis protein TsaB